VIGPKLRPVVEFRTVVYIYHEITMHRVDSADASNVIFIIYDHELL